MYIDDVSHHENTGNSSMATHLNELARKLTNSAKRYTNGELNYGDGSANSIARIEDIALEQQVLAYVKANYGKIGDLSMAHGLVKLVRQGTQVWRG